MFSNTDIVQSVGGVRNIHVLWWSTGNKQVIKFRQVILNEIKLGLAKDGFVCNFISRDYISKSQGFHMILRARLSEIYKYSLKPLPWLTNSSIPVKSPNCYNESQRRSHL